MKAFFEAKQDENLPRPSPAPRNKVRSSFFAIQPSVSDLECLSNGQTHRRCLSQTYTSGSEEQIRPSLTGSLLNRDSVHKEIPTKDEVRSSEVDVTNRALTPQTSDVTDAVRSSPPKLSIDHDTLAPLSPSIIHTTPQTISTPKSKQKSSLARSSSERVTSSVRSNQGTRSSSKLASSSPLTPGTKVSSKLTNTSTPTSRRSMTVRTAPSPRQSDQLSSAGSTTVSTVSSPLSNGRPRTGNFATPTSSSSSRIIKKSTPSTKPVVGTKSASKIDKSSLQSKVRKSTPVRIGASTKAKAVASPHPGLADELPNSVDDSQLVKTVEQLHIE